jgi:hypothetical protein
MLIYSSLDFIYPRSSRCFPQLWSIVLVTNLKKIAPSTLESAALIYFIFPIGLSCFSTHHPIILVNLYNKKNNFNNSIIYLSKFYTYIFMLRLFVIARIFTFLRWHKTPIFIWNNCKNIKEKKCIKLTQNMKTTRPINEINNIYMT